MKNKERIPFASAMGVVKLMLLFTSVSMAQEFRFGNSESFNISFGVDVNASIKEQSPNIVGGITYINHFMYIGANSQILPGLEGGYVDLAGSIGLNFVSGYFETLRYYAGGRLGHIWRGGYGYPLAGLEAGLSYKLSDNIGLGLRGTADYREDMLYSGADPKTIYSTYVTLNFKL